MYDILGFLNFLYSLQAYQQIFFSFSLFIIYQKYFSIILLFLSYFSPENNLVYPNKLLSFNIKSINPIQKYMHITESYVCIVKTCVVMFL